MLMEESSVPWWRKALHFALDGIRSGFGLFSRTPKGNETPEPARPAGQQENPKEESELIDHSPTLDSEEETRAEVEAATSEPVAAPSAQALSQFVPDFEPDLETVPEPAPPAAAEILPVTETEPMSDAPLPQIEAEADPDAANTEEAATNIGPAAVEPEHNKTIEEPHGPAIHTPEEPADGGKVCARATP
jgi:hypothetical protein